jgi:hypothetical protein
MALSDVADVEDLGQLRAQVDVSREQLRPNASAVSWSAILAGAAAAAALSLILLLLGAGLGLSSVSPWSQAGISATTFGVSTILWVTVTQLIAAGMGGYLAGRLRTRWIAVHSDEVYFRDTAHGFLAWAMATLATAAMLSSVIGSIVSGGVQAGVSVAGGAAATATVAAAGGVAVTGSQTAKDAGDSAPLGYFLDSLFRKDVNAIDTGPGTGALSEGISEQMRASAGAEVSRIFMTSMRSGLLPAEDVRYVGQLVAQRTGLSQQDAEKRVSDTYASVQTNLREAEVMARDTADKARKASAYAALWLFVSLLGGAFVASWAATYGGRRRDI